MSTFFWDLFEMPFAEAERPWEACQVGNALISTGVLTRSLTLSLTLAATLQINPNVI